MSSRKQRRAARLNGQKSRGPISIEGKQKSARNAEKHGFNSQYIVLTCEETGVWQRHLTQYFEEWQPETQTETDLVNDIAVCRWRLNRLLAMETAAMDLAVDRSREALDKQVRNPDAALRLTTAFQDLGDKSQVVQNFARYEARFRRTIDRAIAQLIQLQDRRRELEAVPEPEPKQPPASPAPPQSNNPGRPAAASPTPEEKIASNHTSAQPSREHETPKSQKWQNEPGDRKIYSNQPDPDRHNLYVIVPDRS